MSMQDRSSRQVSGDPDALLAQRVVLRQSKPDGSKAPGVTGHSMCRAPSASMYLDQRGDVRACCQSTGFVLGNVSGQSLREIWDGSRAARLRSAVAVGDLSLGCDFCRWQVENGNDEAVFARTFDHLRAPSTDSEWPEQLELSLSNACNLQCVMCSGEFSSSIRTHREGLPPLPMIYGEAFFEELAEFLPHLKTVKFLGGESFLGRESLWVMEMLAESGANVSVSVTTNGTQWSRKIERILDRLDVHVVVSLDGVHRDTYESIRVGASFGNVVANIDRFVEYASRRGTGFSLAHCLMTTNWREFEDFLRFAEERDIDVYVNTVTFPFDLSLYRLHPTELGQVVAEFDRREPFARDAFSGSRLRAWTQQSQSLRHQLALLEVSDVVPSEASAPPIAPFTSSHLLRGEDLWSHLPELAGPGLVALVDTDGRVAATKAVRRPLDEAETELVARVRDKLVVGRDLPLFLRRVLPDQGELYDLNVALPPGGPNARRALVWANPIINRDGVRLGQRLVLGLTSARIAAQSFVGRLKPDPMVIAEFRVDRSGQLVGFSEDIVKVFGIDLRALEGTAAIGLEHLVKSHFGASFKEVRDFESFQGIGHRMIVLGLPDGRSRRLHLFFEFADGEILVSGLAEADDAAAHES